MRLFLEYLHVQKVEFYPETYITFHDLFPFFEICTNRIHNVSLYTVQGLHMETFSLCLFVPLFVQKELNILQWIKQYSKMKIKFKIT